jgi:hypothetical protein
MKTLGSIAALAVASSALAGVSYVDEVNDLFDNGFTNLDISSVNVTNDAENVFITVSTVGFQNWTKYMMYFDTGAGGTVSNGWNRPVILSREIDRYIGSWVDQPNSNAQLWDWNGGAWNLGSTVDNDQSMVGMNMVTFTVSLGWLGVNVGDTFYFDVATSGGGGNDPGVDHLSRSTPATPGWGTPSEAGSFLAYTVVPSPGAVALLGLAGLAGRRRRA